MVDVIVAGAGPAGSIAALTLARAGARVLIVDREAFPRDKLCGDTLNPGTLRLLASLGLTGGPLDGAERFHGIVVTGPRARVVGRYAGGAWGLAVRRRDLDAWLLEAAVRAGARFEGGLSVRRPLLDASAGGLVRGLALVRRGTQTEVRMPAIVTVGADGRRSALAAALGLRVEAPIRRWAFGTYATGVTGTSDIGEMHIRRRWYLGIAPLAGGACNVCLVTPPRPDGRAPLDVIRRAIARDAALAERFADASFDPHVRVLGPLSARVRAPGAPGLLLAGDAAGFDDPMTGDGLHLAMRGAILAAEVALRTLADGQFATAVDDLAAARRATLGPKIRFNRSVCRIVESPALFGLAHRGAQVWPAMIRRAVAYAGDVA